MTVVARKVGLIVASARRGGNAAGIASWLKPVIQSRLNKANQAKPFEVITVDPTSAPFPSGPLTDGSKFPAQVADPKDYSNPPSVNGANSLAPVPPSLSLPPSTTVATPESSKTLSTNCSTSGRRSLSLLFPTVVEVVEGLLRS